ncbi:hypothetical protein BUALT_Bualt11G0105400 [Buddleja alternifolia]|uniref:B box-type domain-containing protein n=1 Tax=Buddleja alternifolia TaxID=168488 RepID=A0AAV6X1A3_9LAMI|nr:hypothetical protein BUALT_Bualt11G0105400 [Buddleja alternifolia]
MLVPPWLERLLNAAFFTACRSHSAAARSECNMYCLDCNTNAFCFYCRSSKHKDHQVIQIRRSSYHDVVRVSEIEKVLDISGVQTYVINSARVLFLNERPQPKGGKAVSRLVGIKKNGDASFNLDAKNEVLMQRGEGISRRVISSSREEEELHEGSLQDIYPPTPPPPSARRRKGIPKRAPFRS